MMVTKKIAKALVNASYDDETDIGGIPIITHYFHCLMDFDVYVIAGQKEKDGWWMVALVHKVREGTWELGCVNLDELVAQTRGPFKSGLEREYMWEPGFKNVADVLPKKYIKTLTKVMKEMYDEDAGFTS